MIPQTDFSSSFTIAENGTITYANAYGSYTFQKIPLQQADSSAQAALQDKFEYSHSTAQDKASAKASTMAFLKPRYASSSLAANPKTRDAWQEVSQQMDDAIGKFMDGTITEDELASQFQTLSHKMYESTAKAGYPLPFVDSTMEQACTEAMYDEFRKHILSTAVQRNNAEGRQYVTGEMNRNRTSRYYNADYYYKSEAGIAALNKGMDGFVQDRGWDYSVPDYKGQNAYYNFNTAVFNQFGQGNQYIVDPDMVPPKGFEWFFETGGSATSLQALRFEEVSNPDGTKTRNYFYQHDQFDPGDQYTANTWVAYTDENGNRIAVSMDIFFKNEISDLMKVGGLISFDVGEKSEMLNAFLNNL